MAKAVRMDVIARTVKLRIVMPETLLPPPKKSKAKNKSRLNQTFREYNLCMIHTRRDWNCRLLTIFCLFVFISENTMFISKNFTTIVIGVALFLRCLLFHSVSLIQVRNGALQVSDICSIFSEFSNSLVLPGNTTCSRHWIQGVFLQNVFLCFHTMWG